MTSQTSVSTVQLHATCVDFDGAGLLIEGDSGSGKSDLALRLIDGGAALVSDDRTDVSRRGETLIASCPPAIAGLMEIRGIGVVPVATVSSTCLLAMIELAAGAQIERLPDPAERQLLGLALPLYRVDPFEASAAAKLRALMRLLRDPPDVNPSTT